MRPIVGMQVLSTLAVLAVCLAACGGSDDGTSTTTTPATATSGTTEAVGAGSGDVAQFAAPEKFWCLDGDPSRAQATLGWSVPAAAAVKVFLDGEQLHSGIRKALPFSVLAGDAPGIGTTVVFSCEPGDEHEVEIRWRLKGSAPPVTRTVTITKASDS